MTSMPSWPMSSSRPMNGLTYFAPAFAARIPRVALETRGGVVREPFPGRPRSALGAPLLAHLVRLGRRDLEADRAVDEGDDVLDHLGPLAARLRDEGGVRRDAVEDAPGRGLANLVDVRGVGENLHPGRPPSSRTRRVVMNVAASRAPARFHPD